MSPVLEQVVARVGGESRRTLDVRQREHREQLVPVVLARPVLEAPSEPVSLVRLRVPVAQRLLRPYRPVHVDLVQVAC